MQDVAPKFDTYVMVDWSAAAAPVTGKDSIWIGTAQWQANTDQLSQQTHNVRTRAEALSLLRSFLRESIRRGQRVLLGFDFAYGYPTGFAKALQLASTPQGPWKSVFLYLRDRIQDGDDNSNNREDVASQCNARIGGGPGPFWGCHAGKAGASLTTKRIGELVFPYHGLQEYRHTELAARRIARPQSVWKLNQGVSVGGQTLMGIRRLAELRFESEDALTQNLRIWPFETGWTIPRALVAVVEIFPSLLAPDPSLGAYRDQQQVASLCRWAAREDHAGRLQSYFQRPHRLTEQQARDCEIEEGWIFGVA